MLASFLTTIFFSLSVIFAARSARVLGGQTANLARICVATVLLAMWAHLFGQGLHGGGLPWFFVSGVIGFGLGDMSLFGALPRIGPRLAILITQCLAAPVAALVEWLWLGTNVRAVDLVCATIILAGVAIALAPDHGMEVSKRTFWIGVLFGVGSALGQAGGAVLSRKANEAAALTGYVIDGGTAAYQRVVGGLLMTIVGFLLIRRTQPKVDAPKPEDRWERGSIFVLANALAGPTLGVGCYQLALRSTPSGIVLPIVATSPLVTIILSFFIDGTRPSRRAVLGGLLAVVGAVLLKDAQANWWLVRKCLNI
ncbi:MAG: DMT family transporter [Chthoniobacter sp.]|uniref:DMT family transporter n=1 Tax=Chthoniobacter sp. TaxID=2510640 RepID=UPI0032A9E933